MKEIQILRYKRERRGERRDTLSPSGYSGYLDAPRKIASFIHWSIDRFSYVEIRYSSAESIGVTVQSDDDPYVTPFIFRV